MSMSDFQDNAPVQLKPIKACAQIIAERDRYREALEAFLDPEMYGWSVSEEVRNHVRRALGIEPVPIK